MANIVVILILLAIIVGATFYIRKVKKSCVKLIGCLYEKTCSSCKCSADSDSNGSCCSCGCHK